MPAELWSGCQLMDGGYTEILFLSLLCLFQYSSGLPGLSYSVLKE